MPLRLDGGTEQRGTPLWWRLAVTVAAVAGAALFVWFVTLLVVGRSGDSTCFGFEGSNRMKVSYVPPQFECITDVGAGVTEVDTHSALLVMGGVGTLDLLVLGGAAAAAWWATRADGVLGWGRAPRPR